MPEDPPFVPLAEDPRAADGATYVRRAGHAVRNDVDVFDVRRSVRREAAALGFTRIVGEELAIVASELCTNIVKYGVRGELALDAVTHPTRGPALALVASDVGRPFVAFERATRDRSDEHGTIPPEAMYGRAGIGGGLGAVRRLSDGVFLQQNADGKMIVAVRFLRLR